MLSRDMLSQKLDNLRRKRKIDILYDEIKRLSSHRVFDTGEQKYTLIASVARATIYLYLIPVLSPLANLFASIFSPQFSYLQPF